MKNNYKIPIIILSSICGILAVVLCCLIFSGIKKDTVTTEKTAVGERPLFIENFEKLFQTEVHANIPVYAAEPNLSNLINTDLYYFSEEETEALSKDLFFVSESGDNEFYEVYEQNRYFYRANFVTVDSLMHTYHLYFSALLKQTEKEYLANRLSEMSKKLQAEAISQYESLKGSEWEQAARRNVAFFTIGAYLQDSNVTIPDYVSQIVAEELKNIQNAANISDSPLFDYEALEDYTQYTPRGYYEGDTALEAYFKAMMWYGRMQFSVETEDGLKSCALISLAIRNTSEKTWEDIYQITSFFAGSSDDLGYYEIYPLLCGAYGENITTDSLIQEKKAFSSFADAAKKLKAPQINSIPIADGESSVIPGFRFMGQRFTIDAAIMQQLVYDSVGNDKNDNYRMLPDVLDAEAALGSDTALELLKEQGDTDYQGYLENMDILRKKFSEDNETSQKLFSASLYANWLNTLRPLLSKKGEGYPMFMQSEKWARRDLECFAGSYTELKHDTILYSKQVYAEMGGGDIPTCDDRGYVQPEPVIYSRFTILADATRDGLKSRNMLSASDEENLSRLAELSDKLYTIAQKELKNETLTEEEYDLIRNYGGNLEHFWLDATKKSTGREDINVQDFPSAIVADIATDPNGQILEIGTGRANTIYVVVPVDGSLRITSGSVYSFYQFPWQMSDRLTDTKWRQMMGLELSADGSYNFESAIERPWWTKDYRISYGW